MERKPGTLEVLLSSYNGERYISSQLESLSQQTYPNFKVKVRDDGSKDSTCEILDHYSAKYAWLTYTKEKNIGVINSFFKLLGSTSSDTEYVAFCDQDDVWEKEKLEVAVKHLNKAPKDRPAMYCSAVKLVDEDLEPLGYVSRIRKPADIRNALAQNIASGCTIVINRTAIDALNNTPFDTSKVRMHDRWMYLVISAIGEVFYDPQPRILYRQHSQNVVGANLGVKKWNSRIKRLKHRQRNELLEQAQELIRSYGPQIQNDRKGFILEFLDGAGSPSLLKRFKYINSSTRAYRQSPLDDLIMRTLILLGWR